MTLLVILIVLSVFMFLITLIPLIRNDYWVFRVLEFPRYQKWWVALLLLIGEFIHLCYHFDVRILSALILVGLAFTYLSYQVYPFTIIAPRHLKSNKNPNSGHVRFIVSNVYQYNRKSHKLIREITRLDVDVMIFVETDHWWMDELSGAFNADFPYQQLHPLENTYGMLLFSKYRLEGADVRFLIKDEVPSISVIVKHPVEDIRLLVVHPEPPVPSENPQATERDMELLKIALDAYNETLPVVVAGDFNDVPWSYTTERFVEESGLLDPRRGRGMFSTFHANYPLLRWPLDHVFCSDHFSLNRIRCLRNVGSDHLPIYVDLAFSDQPSA